MFTVKQETESRLRNEVEKIKKKMAVTIHELEMSLDAANKSNVQLQNSSKQQVIFLVLVYLLSVEFEGR